VDWQNDRSKWEKFSLAVKKGGLILYRYQSKTNGAGVYSHGMRQRFSFRVGQYTTVFQAEAYAIQPCAVENIERGYWRRNIYVLSNSQTAVKALENCKIIESLSGTATSP
jgi:hypothetical protein